MMLLTIIWESAVFHKVFGIIKFHTAFAGEHMIVLQLQDASVSAYKAVLQPASVFTQCCVKAAELP